MKYHGFHDKRRLRFTSMAKIILKIFIFVFVFLLSIFILSACGSDNTYELPNLAEYQVISADDAYRMMRNEDSFILLDVRTEEEFLEARIPGAILIPGDELNRRASSELPDKDALIFVYCRSGRRSETAAMELISMGFTNVYDIGGILDWPYEIITG